MRDPTLKRTRVEIAYTASDGYHAECMYKGGQGSRVISTGAEVPPENALLAALEELARLTALFGFTDQALTVFTEARQRVEEWRKHLKESS